MTTEVAIVGVLGCGQMGAGIAEVCARAGHDTRVVDADAAALTRGMERIRASVERAVGRGKLGAAEGAAALRRISSCPSVDELGPCDLVIEAVPERIDLKQAAFAALGRICRPDAILASNTSSVPIVELARATREPGRVLGMHFFNPVPVMRLVELVRALTTTEETVTRARSFAEGIGKQVIVAGDRAGFLVDYLLVPYLLDAIRLLEQKFASREDIDTGMVLGTGHPMGPLTLTDFVGLDILLHESDVLYDALKETRFVAPTLLRSMVAAGYLGKKSGRGFYNYGAAEEPPRP